MAEGVAMDDAYMEVDAAMTTMPTMNRRGRSNVQLSFDCCTVSW